MPEGTAPYSGIMLWIYRHPGPEAAAVVGHAAAEHPGAHVIVNGTPEARP